MGSDTVSENPYQPPQADLQQERAVLALQPLTPKLAERFFATIVASSVSLWVAHIVAARFLANEYLTAQYGERTWERLLSSAVLHGMGYSYIFALSLLGSIWYFCKNQVQLPALWRQYYYLLGIMLATWLGGGILGLFFNARGWHGWYRWMPNATQRMVAIMDHSPQTAWFLAAETFTEIVGAICLVAIPLLFTIRNRKREAPPLGK